MLLHCLQLEQPLNKIHEFIKNSTSLQLKMLAFPKGLCYWFHYFAMGKHEQGGDRDDVICGFTQLGIQDFYKQ